MARRTAHGKIEQAPLIFKGCLQETVTFRSSWEYKAFQILDKFTKMGVIRGWVSELSKFEYESPVDEKMHTYFMDLTLFKKDNKGRDVIQFIEVKPLAQTNPPKKTARTSTSAYTNAVKTFMVNNAKWNTVKDYCIMENDRAGYTKFEFILWTEFELGIK